MDSEKKIQQAAFETPDPGRSCKNLERLFRKAPHLFEQSDDHIRLIALLFSYSQFLADYSIDNPDALSLGLQSLSAQIIKKKIMAQASDKQDTVYDTQSLIDKKAVVKLLRDIKKMHLLRITLRDIAGVAGQLEIMAELSSLAEALIELALDFSRRFMRNRFGDIKEDSFSLIALGKLGAGELNYSSDVDLLSLYRSEDSTSSGTLSAAGVWMNKITAHEYFCRMTETAAGMLSIPTEDGIAYRVDLRLRPNGQKGALSVSLNACNAYYESWGKTWERMVLIRARPVAGDILLGNSFISGIEPFVWKRSIDYNDVEEIREMKKKIDTVFDVNDIKRGYGGIREVEFFVQTFQLLYGGERHSLRKRVLSEVIGELSKEGFLSGEEERSLLEAYIFLRRIEHILQMQDDLQTHLLPSGSDELRILSRKMQYQEMEDFISELRSKRLMVRDMYTTLLGSSEQMQEGALLLKEALPDTVIAYLSSQGFSQPETALTNITKLNEQLSVGKTLRERTLLRKAVPLFFDQILRSVNKDRVFNIFVSFLEKIGDHASYLDLLLQRKDAREIIVAVFSMSSYLTRTLFSLENFESIFEYPDIRIDYPALEDRLTAALERSPEPSRVVRESKMIEELKSGLLLLMKISDAFALSHSLSMIAGVIIRSATTYLQLDAQLAVIGLGALGGEELNVGSDLDLVFIEPATDTYSQRPEKTAGEFIRFMSGYTGQGVAYRIDMRLRPDGSKGILINNIDGYRTYYMQSAHPWEIQALLKARPISGDEELLKAFQKMRKEVLMKRSGEVTGHTVRDMRKKILQEVARESSGYDLKNGPGGIKEIEFIIQYLQLHHAPRHPNLIAHNTVSAMKSLIRYGILEKTEGAFLLRSYGFLRTVDTLLRLNEEDTLRTDSGLIAIISTYLNLPAKDALLSEIDHIRQEVLAVAEKFYAGTDH
jgi:[glutamine synthetase] adenylyltransferase / [glutamine synthetase]-adenylyl-L-tyrosine phosphorylase